jgi:hypothetical protein
VSNQHGIFYCVGLHFWLYLHFNIASKLLNQYFLSLPDLSHNNRVRLFFLENHVSNDLYAELEKSSTFSHTWLGPNPQIGRPHSRIVVPMVFLRLFWVPVHCNTKSNEKADKLARISMDFYICRVEPYVPTSASVVQNLNKRSHMDRT